MGRSTTSIPCGRCHSRRKDCLKLPLRKLLTNYSGRFLEYLLDRPDVKDVWGEFVHHDFVYRLADGTLPIGNFKNYLVQDYLYLVSVYLT